MANISGTMKKNPILLILLGYVVLYVFEGVLAVLLDLAHFITAARLSGLDAFHTSLALLVVALALPFMMIGSFSKFRVPLPLVLLPFALVGLSAGIAWFTIEIARRADPIEVFFIYANPHSIYHKFPDLLLYMILAQAVQVLVGAWGFRRIRNSILKADENARAKPLVLNLVTGIIGPFLLLISFLLVQLAPIPFLFQIKAKEFLAFSQGNILSIEKNYQKGNKAIRLIPMVHIGKKRFYDSIKADSGKELTLILMEGVTDKQKLLKGLTYKELAKKMGAVEQRENFKPWARENAKSASASGSAPGTVYVVNADVDASAFSPETRELLNKVSGGLESFFGGANFSLDEGAVTSAEHDLIRNRNAELLRVFKSYEEDFDRFIIPWGALHMPGIEKELKALGYQEDRAARVSRVAYSLGELLRSPRRSFEQQTDRIGQ